MEFEQSEFPNCCGITVIGDFRYENEMRQVVGENLSEENGQPPTKAQLEKALMEDTTEAIEELQQGKVMVATTVTGQGHAAAALQKLGYRALGSFRGQDGIVTFWAKGLTLPRRPLSQAQRMARRQRTNRNF